MKEESLLLLSDLQKLINQVVLIDYTIIILGGDSMFPTINKKETGVNLRRIMDMRGVKSKDIQEYLGFGCVQSVYRWLDGVSMPTVDNLYAISKMLQVPMDSIVCGNAGRTKSQMDACLTDQERRVYSYYKKMRELNAA